MSEISRMVTVLGQLILPGRILIVLFVAHKVTLFPGAPPYERGNVGVSLYKKQTKHVLSKWK